MYRRGIPLVAQEDLGYELGLIVPDKDKHLFEKVRTGDKPQAGWGTQISRSDFSINSAFDRLEINIRHTETILPESELELSQALIEVQRSEHDGLLCFDYGELWGTDYVGGHVCLFETLTDNGDITMIDPERSVPKRRTVSVRSLFESMKKHGEANSAGVWIFK